MRNYKKEINTWTFSASIFNQETKSKSTQQIHKVMGHTTAGLQAFISNTISCISLHSEQHNPPSVDTQVHILVVIGSLPKLHEDNVRNKNLLNLLNLQHNKYVEIASFFFVLSLSSGFALHSSASDKAVHLSPSPVEPPPPPSPKPTPALPQGEPVCWFSCQIRFLATGGVGSVGWKAKKHRCRNQWV